MKVIRLLEHVFQILYCGHYVMIFMPFFEYWFSSSESGYKKVLESISMSEKLSVIVFHIL